MCGCHRSPGTLAVQCTQIGILNLLRAQIRCGDLYNDKAVEAFTACAVSDKKCVPQRVDADAFPVPKEDSLDEGFDLNNFQVCALQI